MGTDAKLFLSERLLFMSKYFLSYMIGFAMLIGLFLRRFQPAFLRTTTVGFMVLFSVFALRTQGTLGRHFADWRGASEFVNGLIQSARTPVFLQGWYSESAQLKWHTSPNLRRRLLAPFEYYPVKGLALTLPPGNAKDPMARRYAEERFARVAGTHKNFVLVARPWGRLFSWAMERSHYYGHSTSLRTFGVVWVIYFHSRSVGGKARHE